MAYDKEILDIIPLLDDPDQYIQDALFRHLRNMGPVSYTHLTLPTIYPV